MTTSLDQFAALRSLATQFRAAIERSIAENATPHRPYFAAQELEAQQHIDPRQLLERVNRLEDTLDSVTAALGRLGAGQGELQRRLPPQAVNPPSGRDVMGNEMGSLGLIRDSTP